MKWALYSFFTMSGLAARLAVAGAQTPAPAVIPAVPGVAPAMYFAIDDQRFDVTGMPEWSRPDSIASRPQGVTVDSDSVTLNMKFAGWEAGVIPIEFAADVSQAHRDQFMQICNSTWGGAAYVMCVLRTSQNGFLSVTQLEDEGGASPCHSIVGQARRLVEYQLNLGAACWNERNITHEQGHAFGFIHEHQRADRDSYLSVDTANVASNALSNFTRITSLVDRPGTYDFLSVMHYRNNAFAIDTSKPTMIPRSGYGSFASSMGTATTASSLDRDAIFKLYANYFRSSPPVSVSPNTRFDRTDFLDAMERLHAFYYSRLGLNRSGGLSINGKPDFQGIATWIFDVYLGARSAGFSQDMSFGFVVIDITQSDEWKGKHAGWTSGTRGSFTPSIRFDRTEFLDALQRLDAFYAAPEGLRRPGGLSISGGPDFLGIATWIFDVYLNERLSGGSSTVAWQRVVNAIQSTPEWKSKH